MDKLSQQQLKALDNFRYTYKVMMDYEIARQTASTTRLLMGDALDIIDTLLAAPPTPPDSTPANWIRRDGRKGMNWYTKASSEECARCGTWFEKGHLNQYGLCHACEMALAEDEGEAK